MTPGAVLQHRRETMTFDEEQTLRRYGARSAGTYDAIIRLLASSRLDPATRYLAAVTILVEDDHEEEFKAAQSAVREMEPPAVQEWIDKTILPYYRDERQKAQEKSLKGFEEPDPACDPEAYRKFRIQPLLRRLAAWQNAVEYFRPKQPVEHLEAGIKSMFSGLAQYGINATTLAEAQEQYLHQFREEETDQTVDERIRQGIQHGVRTRVELEALRAELMKEFGPDHHDFISREIRKEQSRTRANP